MTRRVVKHRAIGFVLCLCVPGWLAGCASNTTDRAPITPVQYQRACAGSALDHPDVTESVRAAQTRLAAAISSEGCYSVETAAAMRQLAMALLRQGRQYQVALASLRRAYTIGRYRTPSGILDSADTREAIAFVRFRAGRLKASQRYLEDALHIRRDILGRENPVNAGTYCRLGLLFDRLGEPERSEAMFRRSLEIADSTAVLTAEQKANVLHNLAQVQRKGAKAAEAAATVARAKALVPGSNYSLFANQFDRGCPLPSELRDVPLT